MSGMDHPMRGCRGGACDSGDRRGTALRRALVSQFGHPRGLTGRLAGLIMAHRPANVERSRWTVSLLDLQPTDQVLEIGFGPGIAIAETARLLPEGYVVGVDHSQTMWRQASKRNRRAIQAGRVRLVVGSIEDLANEGTRFDKIFSVNSAGFWPQPVASLAFLASRLAPGGTIALTEQPRFRGADEDAVSRAAERLGCQLTEAGFVRLRLETLALKSVPAVCVLASSTI